jgi:hypothetical protein
MFVLMASAGVAGPQTSTIDKLFELKGVCKLGETWMASVNFKEDDGSFWLKAGQRRGHLQLISYDPETYTAKFTYQDQVFELMIAEADASPIGVLGSTVLSNKEMAEVDRKVEAYRKGLKQILAAPETGPRDREKQLQLEQNLQKSVSDYRRRLVAAYDDNTPSAEVGESSGQNEIWVRRRNRVNSRIWASDHIEKWGLPQE